MRFSRRCSSKLQSFHKITRASFLTIGSANEFRQVLALSLTTDFLWTTLSVVGFSLPNQTVQKSFGEKPMLSTVERSHNRMLLSFHAGTKIPPATRLVLSAAPVRLRSEKIPPFGSPAFASNKDRKNKDELGGKREHGQFGGDP
jgi:hypothetical protein